MYTEFDCLVWEFEKPLDIFLKWGKILIRDGNSDVGKVKILKVKTKNYAQ